MFDKKEMARWVKYAGSDNGITVGRDWAGTEQGEQILPVLGNPFPSTYPFKITKLSDDAKIFNNEKSYFSPPDQEIKIKVAVEMGYVYDLSRLEKSKNKPLLVTKMKNGNYKVIDFVKTTIYTPKDLEAYRIPVILNGKEMKPIDFNDPKSIAAATLEVTVKTNSLGQFVYSGADEILNPGMIFFAFTIGTRIEGNYTPISKLELLSYAQAKEKSGRPNLNDSVYLKNKYLMVLFSAFNNSSYAPLYSFDQTYFSKNTDPGVETLSPFAKKIRNTPMKYSHRFNLKAFPGSPGGFSDHIFLRI